MIVYRCITQGELMAMIHDQEYDTAIVKGENTLEYEKGVSYKHFFMFGNHAEYFRKNKGYHFVGQYVIPNELIAGKGFGFYGNVKTMRNKKLYGYYMPLPEVIVKKEDFKKEYLYCILPEVYAYYTENRLNDDDNKKFNEPIIKDFSLDGEGLSYLDYSYTDIYYEMVYQIAKQHDMDLKKVAGLLKDIDLYEKIREYYANNTDLFREQTRLYVKSQRRGFFDFLKR